MTGTTARIISGLLFLVFSPFCLWWLRREYGRQRKLNWFGSTLHMGMYGFHGMFYGILAWGAETVVPPMGRLPGLGLLSYAALVYAVTLVEEEHLTRTCGESYRGYCQRGPRYLSLTNRS